MTNFYLAAGLLTLVALLVLLRPWWQAALNKTGRATEADALRALNTAIYRDQFAELDRDRQSGQLADADFNASREELQRRLLADTRTDSANPADPGTHTRPTAANPRTLWILLALFLPAAGSGLYGVLGHPDVMLSPAQHDAEATASMEQLIEKLASRLEAQPDNPEGWAMLGRSYASMGRWDEAEQAFQRIGPALQGNPELLATYAEMLVSKTQGDFSGRPRELIAQALKLDADNRLALYLAGADALQEQRWDEVLKRWQPLLKTLQPGSEDANMIQAGINRAKDQMGPPQQAKVGAGDTAATTDTADTAANAANAAEAIRGRVELAPALKDRVKPDDVLFVFARAEAGPRMPLAALRLTVADLPYQFSLSDANALGAPGAGKISTTQAIRIEARIARSGTATATAGDLTGQSAIVKPGRTGLRLVIDTVTP